MEKKLFRIKSNDTVLGGVTLGLANYFNIDVVLVRILFVVSFFSPIPAGIIYFLLWIFLPVEYNYSIPSYAKIENFKSSVEPQTDNYMSNPSKSSNAVFGIILIVLGTIFAFKSFFGVNVFEYIGKAWPLFIVALGVWLIVKDNANKDPMSPPNNNTNP